MEFENQNIKCSIFWDAEGIIRRIDAKIREVRDAKQRQYCAQDILLEARSLLSCPNYNVGNPNCLICYSISRGHLQEYEYLAKSTIRNRCY